MKMTRLKCCHHEKPPCL